MNRESADALAKRIINSSRGGPPLQDWVDCLDELDEGTAGTAYIRLLNNVEPPWSVKRYMEAYHALQTAATRPPRQEQCPLGRCPGDGWQRLEFVENGKPYEGVKPCDCPAGQAHEPAWRSVIKSGHRDT